MLSAGFESVRIRPKIEDASRLGPTNWTKPSYESVWGRRQPPREREGVRGLPPPRESGRVRGAEPPE